MRCILRGQNAFCGRGSACRPGLGSGPHWGSLQCSPRPASWIFEAGRMKRVEKGRGRKGERRVVVTWGSGVASCRWEGLDAPGHECPCPCRIWACKSGQDIIMLRTAFEHRVHVHLQFEVVVEVYNLMMCENREVWLFSCITSTWPVGYHLRHSDPVR